MRTDQILRKLSHRKWMLSSIRAKRFFLEISPKEAVFGKTNYNPLSFTLGPIYEQNMTEIDFSTCATKSRYWSIFVGSRSSVFQLVREK